jgi:hypothetical protein
LITLEYHKTFKKTLILFFMNVTAQYLRKEYEKIDKQAFKKQTNFRCFDCNKKTNTGHIHHNIPIHKADISNYNIINNYYNLKYLCFNCHKKYHPFISSLSKLSNHCPICNSVDFKLINTRKYYIRACSNCHYTNNIKTRRFININHSKESNMVIKNITLFFNNCF